MSYAVCRAGVVDAAAGVAGFSADLVAYEDWQLMNSGVAQAIVIEDGGAGRQEYQAFHDTLWAFHTFHLHALIAYTENVNSITERDTLRDAVLAQFRKYPQLDGTAGVFLAMITAWERVREPIQIGEAGFLRETFTLEVQEDVSGTAVE